MPIAHVATFTFRSGTPAEELTRLSTALGALAATCQGVESYQHGTDLGLRHGTADYAIAAVFRDQEAMYSYLNDPEHRRINAEFANFVDQKSSAQFHAVTG